MKEKGSALRLISKYILFVWDFLPRFAASQVKALMSSLFEWKNQSFQLGALLSTGRVQV